MNQKELKILSKFMNQGIEEEKISLIISYLHRLLEENKKFNLTAIDDYEKALSLHVEDSLFGLCCARECPEGLYGDLGSGCGIPGVVLGIATSRQTLLIDSSRKKMKAVSEILKKLNVEGKIQCTNSRIENFATEKRATFAILSARALGKLPVIIELAAPLLFRGGRLIAYKGVPNDEELSSAEKVCEIAGMQEIFRNKYQLTCEGQKRTIFVYEKTSNPKIELPRRNGLAQKRPLA